MTTTAARFPWACDSGDPALMLFTAAVERFGIDIPPGARILELGCAETNWLERMRDLRQGYDLIGVDARVEQRGADGFRLVQGDATRPRLCPWGSFDVVVMLGALEHFGLGYYGDPIVEGGDILTMQNVVRWLKPGGLVYFDVPCNPTHRIMENRHFRTYSPDTIEERLIVPGLAEIARGYVPHEPANVWIAEPTVEAVPYHYCAVLARKVVS